MRFEDEPVPGYPLPILPGHTSPGRFERVLRAGGFAVTTELAPPDSADPEEVYRRARLFDGYVDAINATDGSGANCHMSSLAVCALLTRVGYAPIMQISCRDKNRIAIQGDILGAAAMGVCNVLCLTGDGVQAGNAQNSSTRMPARAASHGRRLSRGSARPFQTAIGDSSSMAARTTSPPCRISSNSPAAARTANETQTRRRPRVVPMASAGITAKASNALAGTNKAAAQLSGEGVNAARHTHAAPAAMVAQPSHIQAVRRTT